MFSLFKRGSPIASTTSIDVMAKRKDGVLELLIVPAGSLDSSPATQKLLLDKIETYLSFLQSEECSSEFGELEASQKLIAVIAYRKPDSVLSQTLEAAGKWVADSGATFEVRLG